MAKPLLFLVLSCLLLVPWKLDAVRLSQPLEGMETKVAEVTPKEQDKPGAGFWNVSGTNFVDAQNNTVYFSGVIWSGFETPDAVIHGLWTRTIESHLDQMKSLGFNMIRLPFAGETLRPDQRPTVDIYGTNPDLKNLTSLEIMDRVVEGCSLRGIKVILCYHRIKLTISNEKGMWFDEMYNETVWLSNWSMLARRYKGNPTVIGADLFNEVHGWHIYPDGAPFWKKPMNSSTDEVYNFRSASLRAIHAIHHVERNWIVFLEGMGHGYWWGGDVAALLKAPIEFPMNKVAYSAHEYGPRVYMQKWFTEKTFPKNLKPLWSSKWGLAIEQGLGPVWIGEFGSFYPPATNSTNKLERVTFETLIGYIGELKASWTIAFWNPNSKDTGGILNDDWTTVNQEKLQVLRPIMYPDFKLL